MENKTIPFFFAKVKPDQIPQFKCYNNRCYTNKRRQQIMGSDHIKSNVITLDVMPF